MTPNNLPLSPRRFLTLFTVAAIVLGATCASRACAATSGTADSLKIVSRPVVYIGRSVGTLDGRTAVWMTSSQIFGGYSVGQEEYVCDPLGWPAYTAHSCWPAGGLGGDVTPIRRGVWETVDTFPTQGGALLPPVVALPGSFIIQVKHESCSGGAGPWYSGEGSTCGTTPGWLDWSFTIRYSSRHGQVVSRVTTTCWTLTSGGSETSERCPR
jgi:hypothetical protein